MSVIDYCCAVQKHVRSCKPAKDDPTLREWFGDTGRASIATSAALEGHSSKALRIAEPLAERYNLP